MRSEISIRQLVTREIRFRLTGFLAGLLCVTVAVACVIALLTLLDAHNLRTEQLLLEKMELTQREMHRLEDDFRRITRDLGYNVMILHKDQNLSQLRAIGYPTMMMPEAYAYQLGRAGGVELNHLLPVLQKRVVWPERQVEILISGVVGQVPVYHKARFLNAAGEYRDPIMATIPPGRIDLGFEIARELALKTGDQVTLFSEAFTVNRVYPRRGGVEDIAVWCELGKVQKWHGLEGQINGILALECFCDFTAVADGRLAAQIQGVIPDTQVLDFGSKVVARAQTRLRAQEEHGRAIEAEAVQRDDLRRRREALAAVLIPLALGGSGVWIFFLTLANVRERRSEVAILRTIGMDEAGILSIFLLKAALIGVVGATIGCLIGVVIGALWGDIALGSPAFGEILRVRVLIAVILAAPVLSGLAAYLPAMIAARTDPAVVLMRDE